MCPWRCAARAPGNGRCRSAVPVGTGVRCGHLLGVDVRAHSRTLAGCRREAALLGNGSFPFQLVRWFM